MTSPSSPCQNVFILLFLKKTLQSSKKEKEPLCFKDLIKLNDTIFMFTMNIMLFYYISTKKKSNILISCSPILKLHRYLVSIAALS